jgi:hypothetical protein
MLGTLDVAEDQCAGPSELGRVGRQLVLEGGKGGVCRANSQGMKEYGAGSERVD